VEPDHLARAGGGGRQASDRDRRRVGGQDRLGIRDHGVEPAEDVFLQLLVLGDGFDDELAVGEPVEIGDDREPGEGLGLVIGGQLAAVHRPLK
jgi:hypothetical protein